MNLQYGNSAGLGKLEESGEALDTGVIPHPQSIGTPQYGIMICLKIGYCIPKSHGVPRCWIIFWYTYIIHVYPIFGKTCHAGDTYLFA